MFTIEINPDQTIRYVSHFAPGRGSLSALGASGLVKYLNQIPDLISLMAVTIGMGSDPHLLSAGCDPKSPAAQDLARQCLAIARDGSEERAERLVSWQEVGTLGDWRKALCVRYCGGMNAPGDLWIRTIAHACEREQRAAARAANQASREAQEAVRKAQGTLDFGGES